MRHALLPRGQGFAAQPVAQQGSVGVAAVFHPCQLVFLGVGEQLGAGNSEEGAPQTDALIQRPQGWHGGKCAQPAAAQGGQQQGFGLVIGMVGKGDRISVALGEAAIAFGAGGGLQP